MTTTDGLEWLRQRIEWDKAHRVRYRLRRVWYHATHPRKAYRQAIYWPVRRFIERGRRGWSVSDTWGFDTYIAGVLADGIERLRDDLHGHPGNLTPEEWESILTEMAAGFRRWANHYDDIPSEDEAYRAVRKSIRLMHRWFGHLWD